MALVLAVGCGGSSVTAVTDDAATTDLVAVDVGSIDVGSTEVSVRDAGLLDTGREVPPEARVCPRPFDEDVPCATRPAPVRGLDRVDRIFVGVWGGCALRLDHSVWCWGSLGPALFTGELGQVTW